MSEAPVILDFESRSRADLKSCGGRRYWEHPSTEALCCAWYDMRNGASDLWVPGEAWPHDGRDLVAHNGAHFDRFGGMRYGWRPRAWLDSSNYARRAGLPGKLDALGSRWLGIPKDSAGSTFTKALSSVRRARTIAAAEWRTYSPERKRECGVLPELTLEKFVRVVDYCVSDVAIVVGAWPRLREWQHTDEAAEAVDIAVNDRGVAFDSELAHVLLERDADNCEQAACEAARVLGMTPARVREIAGSPAQIGAVLHLPNAQKATLANVDHPLANVRRALASIARGKLQAGLARVSLDGRLRDSHQYYGAHTGRWSGRGMQLQNMPRPVKRFEDWTNEQICQLAHDVVYAWEAADGDEIDLLLRACIIAAPGHLLVARDYAGIEARVLAWAACDVEALDVFIAGKLDPYKVMAAVIFGCAYADVDKIQRTVGKIAELALGYQQGPDTFAETARKVGGVDLAAIGVNPKVVVEAWRTKHAPIVRLWYAAQRAFQRAAEGGVGHAGVWRYLPSDTGDVACELPSGRLIVYNEVELHQDARGRVSATALGTRGREHIYGGLLVENATQATCRDLFADALVRSERAGLRPVMHVHDEIVCEVLRGAAREAAVELERIMLSPPMWAAGIPIKAAGFESERYRK